MAEAINIYPIIHEVKDALVAANLANTVKIGIETGINLKDVPFLRIVPIKFEEDEYGRGTIDVQVVFGFTSNNRDYEDVQALYWEMEANVRNTLVGKLERSDCLFLYTVTDEDTVKSLKTGISVFSLKAFSTTHDEWLE